MKIFNTKTRKLEEFKPLGSREVKVYYCGPTVYNHAHIWNLRTYVFEDVVVKTLRYLGYPVHTVMNITDIDDKTIRDSVAAWEKLLDFTQKFTKTFLEDIDKLWIQQADIVSPISELIPEMVRMIQTMINRKNAYIADDGSVYFSVKTSRKYWKLANIDMSGMKSSVRIDNDEYDKDQASDFVLWKAYKESDGDNSWDGNFTIDGKEVTLKGRPGWHIECSACNMKHFGPQIDIHMWGIDNLFPHHQNEVAQTEACTRKEFSKYWLHGGHLSVDGKKMAKSANNFYRLSDIVEKKSEINTEVLYRAMRLSLMNAKYASQIDFSFDKLDANINVIESIDEFTKMIHREIESGEKELQWMARAFREYLQEITQEYVRCLEDDFNIPEALALFHGFMKEINTKSRAKELSLAEYDSIRSLLENMNYVFGIIDFTICENEVIPAEIQEKLELRNTAKTNKDFTTADSLRDELLESGYKIVDEIEGSRVEKI